MRIIGGREKGRRIVIPAGLRIRPTSDRIKESLFNILPDVHGARFLDLFAGTGNVGMEALSRGAVRAVFIENNVACIEVIRVHLDRFGFRGQAECIAAKAGRAAKILGLRGERFEVVFMDPPYEEGFVMPTLVEIGDCHLLAGDGMVAVQQSVREKAEVRTGRLKLVEERVYGDSVLSFWKWR